MFFTPKPDGSVARTLDEPRGELVGPPLDMRNYLSKLKGDPLQAEVEVAVYSADPRLVYALFKTKSVIEPRQLLQALKWDPNTSYTIHVPVSMPGCQLSILDSFAELEEVEEKVDDVSNAGDFLRELACALLFAFYTALKEKTDGSDDEQTGFPYP